MKLKLKAKLISILIVGKFLIANIGLAADSFIIGKVFSVNGDIVELQCKGGSTRLGETLYILQKGEPIGKIKVTQTFHTKSKAKLLESSVTISKGMLFGRWKETQNKIITPNLTPSEIFKTKTGIEFVFIPAGEFLMGCSEDDIECGEGEKPAHKVKISKSFFMSKYEITQEQWEKVMGVNPSGFMNCGKKCPVEGVSFDDVHEFLDKLNEMEDLKEEKKIRLPTEAEWEYAARGGSKAKIYENDLKSIAWYKDNSESKTHPVGQKKPNAFGLYDMLGNVTEWTEDMYGENYYSKSEWTDPKGPSYGKYRSMRGCSWNPEAKYCRVSFRFFSPRKSRERLIGFRVILP